MNHFYDIALIELDDVLTVAPAIRYRGTGEYGEELTRVGYGRTGTGITGQIDETEGNKRAGQNVFDEIGDISVTINLPFPLPDETFDLEDAPNHVLWSDFDEPNNPLADYFGTLRLAEGSIHAIRGLEYSAAKGDSGGGVFIQQDGRTQLAAVTSFINGNPIPDALLILLGIFDPTEFDSNPDEDYGDLNGDIRISSFNTWIDQQLGSIYFNNPAGGNFQEFYNWSNGVPTSADDVIFNSPNTYTVDFNVTETNDNILVDAGDVTFDLDGNTYNADVNLNVGVSRTSRLELANGLMDVANTTRIYSDGTLALNNATLALLSVFIPFA